MESRLLDLELSEVELNRLELPVILKSKELMAPGVWNDTEFSASEISKAFSITNWKDKDVISLFLDHIDDPSAAASHWVGWVKNIKLQKDGRMLGDLEIWDQDTAVKLKMAKAKFGISPKIRGKEDEKNRMSDFTFENFSIVTRPAVRSAYINLSEKMKGGKEEMPKEIKKLETEEEKPVEEIKEEPKVDEVKKEDVKEEVKEEVKAEAVVEEAKTEEMSDDDLIAVTQLSDWKEFSTKLRAKYPTISFRDTVKAYKDSKQATEALEELSETDLLKKLNEVMSVLNRRSKNVVPQKTEAELAEEKLDALQNKVAELSEKLSEPDSKTLMLSDVTEATTEDSMYEGMSGFLEGIRGTGQGITVSLK